MRVHLADTNRLRVSRTWYFSQDAFGPSIEPLRVLGARLKRNGTLAFMAGPERDLPPGATFPEGQVRSYSVHLAAHGRVRELDSGRGVRPDSFRATNKRVFWQTGDSSRSVRLP
jgi:hypothetical protein